MKISRPKTDKSEDYLDKIQKEAKAFRKQVLSEAFDSASKHDYTARPWDDPQLSKKRFKGYPLRLDEVLFAKVKWIKEKTKIPIARQLVPLVEDWANQTILEIQKKEVLC